MNLGRKKSTNETSVWYVYLISNGTRTYIGSTTDIHRRLRQHNGELVGGARSTRGFKWNYVAYVSGFETRSIACRWEKLVKSRGRGIEKRLLLLKGLIYGICPPYGTRPQYEVPSNLTLYIKEN